MNKQRTREQGNNGPGSVEQLLRHALPLVGDQADSPRDLWPAVKRGLNAPTPPARVMLHVPWFDWALACGLVAMLALFPAWIPVLLYCL